MRAIQYNFATCSPSSDIEPAYVPPDAIEAKLKNEIANWTKFIDAKGIKAE